MSLAFLALTSSSSVSRSLIGSVCFFTHFLRDIGLTRPQKPSFAWLFNGLAVWEGCWVEGGLSCEPGADCPCCAAAGIAIADAKAKTANWLGNKFRARFDLI